MFAGQVGEQSGNQSFKTRVSSLRNKGVQAGRNDEFSDTTSASLKKVSLLVRKQCIETMVLVCGNNHFAARFLPAKKKQGTFVAARFVFQCKTKVCSSRLFLVKKQTLEHACPNNRFQENKQPNYKKRTSFWN